MSNYASKSQMIEIMSDAATKIDTKLATKVTKEDGKGLSSNDFTNEEKAKLAGLENYDDTEIKSSINGKVNKVDGKGLSTNDYTDTEKTKLAGLENYDDTTLQTAVNGKLDASLKGVANGVAELGSDGKVPSSQLPGFVDETIEGYLNPEDGKFYKESTYTTEITGTSSVIYVDLNTEKIFRWSGTQFTEISSSIALGETSSTAYPGNKGAANASAIVSLQSGKVDKADGKGLSTNDYTDDEKTKLAGISDLTTDDVTEVKNSFSLT